MQLLTIAGTVGRDAVLRRTGSGDPVLNFSLAVDNGKDRDGNKRPATWFDCSIWGKRAEALERHITKGLRLAVSGRPSARAHEGKAYLGVNVDQLTFQGGGQEHGWPSSEGQQDQQRSEPAGDYGGMDDEIPF